MKIVKDFYGEYPQFNKYTKYLTEKAICYVLEKNGIKFNESFKLHKKIDNIPFCKNNKHEVDFVLNNADGFELYVEIKGQMTYEEVNKLQYLLDETSHNFYILQLTEIDWIEPYDKDKCNKSQKSKDDFVTQIKELVDFVNGDITGEELSERAKKRLTDFINYRAKDIERWKAAR